MFKKFTILSILALYSISCLGISVNLNYCCGKLKTISFESHPVGTKECPERKGKKCCEQVTLQVKNLDTRQNNGFDVNGIQPLSKLIITHPVVYTLQTSCVAKPASKIWLANPPPLLNSFTILYNVFRI